MNDLIKLHKSKLEEKIIKLICLNFKNFSTTSHPFPILPTSVKHLMCQRNILKLFSNIQKCRRILPERKHLSQYKNPTLNNKTPPNEARPSLNFIEGINYTLFFLHNEEIIF